MRQLFIPACLCIATMSGAAGLEAPVGLKAATAAHAEQKGERSEKSEPAKQASSAPAQQTAPASDEKTGKIEKTETNAAKPVEAKPEAAANAEVHHAANDTAVPLPPRKPRQQVVVHRSRREICDTLAKAARSNELPVPFFIRLLFQESRFKAGAVSHVGAQGIAQFMPTTAANVGLDNPFDPVQAIPAAARLLRSLLNQFGNVGLAAAAYNAGPGRVHKWLHQGSNLPDETRGYVRIITGQPAENWKAAKGGHGSSRVPERAPCHDVSAQYAFNGTKPIPLPLPAPIRPAIEIKTAQVSEKAPPKSEKGHPKPGKATASASAKTGNGNKTALQLAARRHAKKKQRHTGKNAQHLAAR